VGDGADEEGYDHGDGLGEVRARRVVDVAAEEIVYWNVPFAGEFEPVSLSAVLFE